MAHVSCYSDLIPQYEYIQIVGIIFFSFFLNFLFLFCFELLFTYFLFDPLNLILVLIRLVNK